MRACCCCHACGADRTRWCTSPVPTDSRHPPRDSCLLNILSTSQVVAGSQDRLPVRTHISHMAVWQRLLPTTLAATPGMVAKLESHHYFPGLLALVHAWARAWGLTQPDMRAVRPCSATLWPQRCKSRTEKSIQGFDGGRWQPACADVTRESAAGASQVSPPRMPPHTAT